MLNSFKLKENKVDSCVFISEINNHLLIVKVIATITIVLLIAIFVDDGLVAVTTDEMVNDLVRCLKDNIERKEGDFWA